MNFGHMVRRTAEVVAVTVGFSAGMGVCVVGQFGARVVVESAGVFVPPETFGDWAVFMGAQAGVIAAWFGCVAGVFHGVVFEMGD